MKYYHKNMFTAKSNKELDRLFHKNLNVLANRHKAGDMPDEWFELFLSTMLSSYMANKVEKELENSFTKVFE
jgi:hypothetical protein